MKEQDYFFEMMQARIADTYPTQVIDVRSSVAPQRLSDMEGAEQWANQGMGDLVAAGRRDTHELLQSDSDLDLTSVLASETSHQTRQKLENALGLAAVGLAGIKVKTNESPIQAFPPVVPVVGLALAE
eukprot:TRINITY_DN12405_c0_g4_i2.p1 TRINITY_DN12405_c0_g4~~TRINITY_DN12405_c0_g4_i2.p1  ORF type:complete len:128 (+),score=23.14 TRINITY_DN12405_c0_g4_i2:328-711(+)